MTISTVINPRSPPTPAQGPRAPWHQGVKQHRNRNTWTRDALEAGIPETAIVQMGGWGSVDMLRR